MSRTLRRRRRASLHRVVALTSLVALAVFLQTIVFPNLRVLGVVPEVGLVMAVAIAWNDGPESGAAFGFAQGLAVDLFLNSPFGLSALAFAMTAFLVGVLQEALVRVPRFAAVFVTFAAGLVSGAIFVLVGALLGQEELFAWTSVRIVASASVYDAVLAPVVFPLVRRVVRPPSS